MQESMVKISEIYDTIIKHTNEIKAQIKAIGSSSITTKEQLQSIQIKYLLIGLTEQVNNYASSLNEEIENLTREN